MLNCDLKSSADHSSIMGLVLDVLAVDNYFFFLTKILVQSQTAELATVEVFQHLNPSQHGMMVNATVGGCTKNSSSSTPSVFTLGR